MGTETSEEKENTSLTSLQQTILVPRARRFLVTWSSSLQIKPSGFGDMNGFLRALCERPGSLPGHPHMTSPFFNNRKPEARWGPFLENPDNFSGPESRFVFTVFTFKDKVSIILTMIQWNYHLTKQNSLVCELGTALLIKRFWI